jgi:hypothetical protein
MGPLLRLAPALIAALLVGCTETEVARARPGQPPTCVEKFSSCAPAAPWARTAEASRLDLQKQVHVSLRIDVPKALSSDAAGLVLRVAQTADVQGLLELAAIREEERARLQKCQCPGIQNEYEKKGIDAVLEKRLPSAELRSPKTWEGRMLGRLAEMRELTHKIAMRRVSGEPAEDLEASRQTADLELCHTVHGARTFLLPDVYRETIEDVLRRREADAGAASAELGRAAIAAHEKTATCEPPDPGGASR